MFEMIDDMAWKETIRKVDEQLSRYVVLDVIAIRISTEPIVESNHKRFGAIALQKQRYTVPCILVNLPTIVL